MAYRTHKETYHFVQTGKISVEFEYNYLIDKQNISKEITETIKDKKLDNQFTLTSVKKEKINEKYKQLTLEFDFKNDKVTAKTDTMGDYPWTITNGVLSEDEVEKKLKRILSGWTNGMDYSKTEIYVYSLKDEIDIEREYNALIKEIDEKLDEEEQIER